MLHMELATILRGERERGVEKDSIPTYESLSGRVTYGLKEKLIFVTFDSRFDVSSAKIVLIGR